MISALPFCVHAFFLSVQSSMAGVCMYIKLDLLGQLHRRWREREIEKGHDSTNKSTNISRGKVKRMGNKKKVERKRVSRGGRDRRAIT